MDLGYHTPIPSATATFRTAGANRASYLAATLPVLGTTFSATVDVGTSGHTFAWLIGYASPLSSLLGDGQVVLVNTGDPAGELVAQSLQAGPLAAFDVPVPHDTAYAGYEIFTQAVHLGNTEPFVLSNALDLTLGF